MNKILIMIYKYLLRNIVKKILNTVMNSMMLLDIPIVSIIYIKSMII